ncbi:MAG: beta-ketoacyl synthase, partial [SAR324 cluster bacterium]|nr:beta-ketoacyl synthase [SAR324 cluster bacterium]
MSHLPVIVGIGGINSAGRTSFHHGYRRLVIEKLSGAVQAETYTGLATLMGQLRYHDHTFLDQTGVVYTPALIAEKFGPMILKNTLLRRVGSDLFDADHVPYNKKMKFTPWNVEPVSLRMIKKELPVQIPESWKVEKIKGDPESVKITFSEFQDVYFPDYRKIKAQTTGQLPTGFDPASLYVSKNHPRGLQMAVYAATDAVRSMGIEWQTLLDLVEPDQIGVYASSAMGQLDLTGSGGMMKAGALNQRTSSKQLAMGLVQMPADFINAYVLGNLGHTSAQVGACATQLYNFYAAVKDIQMGRRKVAIVGSSEAPLIPEIIEGYRAMSALGDDTKILKLDDRAEADTPDYHRACRPFSKNCGFSLGESAQYFVLFADDLAVELGAQILGAVGDVFIHADGFKKSISSPGFGNNISLAKAAGLTRSIIGERALQQQTFISAHGTGTPQNRTTESFGLNEIAKAFGIKNWPVSAIKCYVGHSLGPASGDQLASLLGTWKYGFIPGIATLDEIAEDVHQSNLHFSQAHIEVDLEHHGAALINSKGFGGNNGTGVILSPLTTHKMLAEKHGRKKMSVYQKRNSSVADKANEYDQETIKGRTKPIYKFGKNVLEESDLNLTDQALKIPGFKKSVNLDIPNP